MKIIYKARSTIELHALLTELEGEGIIAQGADRPTSSKVADSTVDMSFMGVSATLDGFPISVEDSDVVKANQIVEKFLQRTNVDESDLKPTQHLHKFYMCSVYVLFLPVVFHIVGLYHLWKGLESGEKIKPFKLLGSMILFIPTSVYGYFLVKGALIWLGEFIK